MEQQKIFLHSNLGILVRRLSLIHISVDDSFRKLNNSSVADVKNTGGRLGGTITAGLFIENFVANNTPWIHLDIAGTAYLSKPEGYLPKGATGVHVKTLYNLLNK